MKAAELIVVIFAAVLVGVLLSKRRNSAGGDELPEPKGSTLSAAVQQLGTAIAAAEGFSVPGSVPARNHNPGDLKADLTGKAVGKDSRGFAIYANDSDGWDALFRQCELMLTNRSRIYNAGMSIADVARHYTATEQDIWASIVAQKLGVSPDTTLKELLA